MNLKEYFSHDLLASVVVFLVALPLCLGIALASGAPLQAGLIAGVVGGIVVGSVSGSHVAIAGPAAGLTTIVIASIAELGSFEAFVVAVFLAGVIQFIMGLVKGGAIGHFFPASVIKGMLAAIGLILVLKQFPHAVGYDEDYEGDEAFFEAGGHNTISDILDAVQTFSGGAVIVSVVSIALILIWDNTVAKKKGWMSFIPGPLIAVVIGVALSEFFKSSAPNLAIESKHLVDVPNFLAGAGASLISPDFSRIFDLVVLKIAFTIAIVASLETLLCAEACDKLDPQKRTTPLNRELVAQGAGNMVSGLLGGLPVTSVIVRSSANISAGAKSKASAISHGVILGLAVLFLAPILRLIPLSALAGILIMVGYKLTPPKLYKEMFQKGWSQFLPFIVTVVTIVFTDLLAGVFLGILVSMLFIVKANIKEAIFTAIVGIVTMIFAGLLLGAVAGIVLSVIFIIKANFKEAVTVTENGQTYMMKFKKHVSFLSKSTIRSKFETIPSNSTVLIDGTAAHSVDPDIKETIKDFIERSKSKKIEVELKSLAI